jgi:DNA repair exonuclease SbcCD ATPase subunit
VVPSKPVSKPVMTTAGEPSTSESGSIPVGRYAHEELAQIRAARESLEEEKRAAEGALEQRRQELERQSQLLVGRLQELHDREQRLAEELEDALPERHNDYPRRTRGRSEASEESQILESETLRRQLRDQQMSLELLSAERDAAWSQLHQYRDQQAELEQLRAERDQLKFRLDGDGIFAEPPPPSVTEVEELRQQLEGLKKQYEQLRAERDEAWSVIQELPERVQQLEKVKAERDAALDQLRALTEKIKTSDESPSDSEWVDLDSPQGEQTLLKIQASEQRDQMMKLREQVEKLRVERDEAWRCVQDVQALPTRQQDEILQLRSERDAALEQLRQLSMEPEHWSMQEAEFAALRLQLKHEQRQLAEDRQELHRRESEMVRRTEVTRQEVQREQQRLEEVSHELEELAQQLREDRGGLEGKERDLRLRDAQNHLREAEIREMIEIAELDNARERSELNQERLKLARLREAIRLEREAVRAEAQKRGLPPSTLGTDV